MLSAFVHGGRVDGAAVVDAAVRAAAALDEARAKAYADLAIGVLGDAVRPILEQVMPYLFPEEPFSDWAKGHYREGQIDAKREAIHAALKVRRIKVSAVARKRIDACTKLAILDRWFRRAVTATKERDVL
ncbi:MAG: hypothetical protein KIT84_12200 [Labilithrix sp.]|nr:hypothetical protein [Labilithrix sp.]